jgi:hypothetical protein
MRPTEQGPCEEPRRSVYTAFCHRLAPKRRARSCQLATPPITTARRSSPSPFALALRHRPCPSPFAHRSSLIAHRPCPSPFALRRRLPPGSGLADGRCNLPSRQAPHIGWPMRRPPAGARPASVSLGLGLGPTSACVCSRAALRTVRTLAGHASRSNAEMNMSRGLARRKNSSLCVRMMLTRFGRSHFAIPSTPRSRHPGASSQRVPFRSRSGP